MKFLIENKVPKIKVDESVLDKLRKYANNMTKRATIACDCVLDSKNDIEIIEAFIPPQTWDYTKNTSKYEEINPFTGYKEDKQYGTVYCQCLIRNNLNKTSDQFDQKDFDYFLGLTEVTDWLIVGEICKSDSSSKDFLTLWYIDIENSICYGYNAHGTTLDTGFDSHWEVETYEYFTDEQINKEISSSCKDKVYSGSLYSGGSYSGGYSGGYSQSGYSGNYAGAGYGYKTDTKPLKKSELNEKDPDLFSLVKCG